MGEYSLVLSEHELSGWLAPLDFSNGVFECGRFGAWTAWESILADGGLTELLSSTIWVEVDVDVGDTHGGGWNV